MIKSTKQKKNYSSIVKKSVLINSSSDKVWRKISNIAGLPEWVLDVKKTVYLSKIKRGVGAIRNITFDDGNQIEEHVVAWKNKKYFSYLAISGLPLRVYHATISMEPQTRKSTRVTWQSYINSKKMTKREFNEFVFFLGSFYQSSLDNLKSKLEK
jgi:Polyketide cyclase / dehydrase and lipid transport